MFILFKKRNFNDYLSDTITFFKTFGKHYFKNYFIINGAFLMVLVVLMYFLSKFYMDTVFSNIKNPNPNFLINYFSDNAFLFIGIFVFFILLTILLSLINITYPIIYLSLVEKNNDNNFTTATIISSFKENTGRILLFFVGTIFIILPIMMLILGLLFAMVFILIGIPLLIIVGPAFLSWIALSYYEFIIKKTGFFESLVNGYRLIMQRFWGIVGTTVLTSIIVQMLQGMITMIPYIIGIVYMVSSTHNFQENENAIESLSIFAVFIAIIMVLSVVLSYFFNNILIINQGLIYYGLREENEGISTVSQIDTIGTDFE